MRARAHTRTQKELMIRGGVGVGKCVYGRVTKFRESNGRAEKTHLPRQCNKLIIKNKNKKMYINVKTSEPSRANERRGGGKKVTLCVCSRRGIGVGVGERKSGW